MRPGTQQSLRLLDALRPGFVLPDEQDLAQRIRLTLQHASRLRFLDGDGRDIGHWGEALLQDASVVLADAAAFPLERLASRFHQEAPAAPRSRLLDYLWHLDLRVDQWIKRIQGHETPGALTFLGALEGEIQGRLAAPLRRALTEQHPSADRVRAHPWHPRWDRHAAAATGGPGLERQELRHHVLDAFQALDRLTALARKALDMEETEGRHDPSHGLLLAFLHLLERAQAPLNRFPDRLVRFYHEEVLGMQPRPAAEEQAHLLLRREPTFPGEVTLAAGTRFVAGQDTTGADIQFAAAHNRTVTDVRVGALVTFRLERSPSNSPEREFGFATRAKAAQLPLVEPADAYRPEPDWWPLFGGEAKGAASHGQDARLGWALSSPLLELREGRRRLRLRLRLAHPAKGDARLRSLLEAAEPRDASWLALVFERYAALEAQTIPARPLAAGALARSAPEGLPGSQRLRYHVARCLEEDGREAFCHRLGLLFAAWLVASEDLDTADLMALRAQAARLLPAQAGLPMDIDDPLHLVFGTGMPERDLLFDRIFRGVWGGRLSASGGWADVPEIHVRREKHPPSGGIPRSCLELAMDLEPDFPAVVPCSPTLHGAAWPAEPMIQLELQTRTRLFSYSLFRELMLEDVEILVAATGVKDLVLHNQMGRLDPGRPFQPFGPLPERGHYLVLGGPELSRKPVRSLRVNLRWSGLPPVGGGFPEHHAAYPGEWRNEGFQVSLSLLRDGHWKAGRGAPMVLFASAVDGRALCPDQCLALDEGDLASHHKPLRTQPNADTFDFGRRSRNGFFRLELSGPEEAFGHALHSRLLTEVLTRNARLKRQEPLPNRPYTPVLEQVSVDYTATRVLRFSEGQEGTDRLFHLHAFGTEELRPSGKATSWPLLPRIDHDGNLFIGLEGAEPRGALSLFFHLREEEAAERWSPVRWRPRWSVWTAQGWRFLRPEEVLSDETQGYLRSGIVTLDLPADLARGCPRLPGDLWWLRLGLDGGFAHVTGLHGVHAQAIRVKRVTPPPPEDPGAPLPPGTIAQPMLPVPGLRGLLQVGPTFGVRPADTPEQVRIRASERLRHKGRASQPADFERLLLDAFPQVFKATCFPHHRVADPDTEGDAQGLERLCSAPGHVLVVVVPQPRQGELFHGTHAPRMNAATLERMADFLRQRCAPGLQLTVRNASYERIQVRCAVRLSRGAHPGTTVRALNEALVRYLSPWHAEGYAPSFDWKVRMEDLEVFLRNQPSVEAVGQISLLHLVRDDAGHHQVRDTAREAVDGVLRPVAPWSLMLPLPRHLIDLQDAPEGLLPEPTGVGRLEVGQTFVLGRKP